MAGYSGTPLARKLGIKPGQRVAFPRAPATFAGDLGTLPDDVRVLGRVGKAMDLVVAFCPDAATLRKHLPKLDASLTPDGALWIAWPKKASGVATDLTGDVVRATGLDQGLVDVKVCAIDEVWSGLKFVVRKRDRAARR